MSEMGDMKFTTAGDMMMDLPSRLESWAQNEESFSFNEMTEHGHDCVEAAELIRALQAALKECADDLEVEINHRYRDTAHKYQTYKHKRDVDMEPVNKARDLLLGIKQ
jgi:DNA-binding FrmR family transcriptional regulator